MGWPSCFAPASIPARWWRATRQPARRWSPATRSTPPRAWSRPPSRVRSCWVRPPTGWCATRSWPSQVSRLRPRAKPSRCPAYRLISVTPGAAGHARRLDAPMVGRERELKLLSDAFDRCVAERTSQLVTLLGEAGVGKSRLVHEFRQQLEGRATFLLGRCLSYGEGITYWPLADALRAPAAVDDDNSVESWRTGLMALIAGQPQAEAIVAQVMGLLGVGEAAGSSEAFWAVRRLLEGMAHARPLVVVIDDVHWATPTFLDLVEHLAGWTRDAPILLVVRGPPRAARGTARLGHWRDESHDRAPRSAGRRVDRRVARSSRCRRRGRGRSAAAHRRRGRGQPPVRGGAGGDAGRARRAWARG